MAKKAKRIRYSGKTYPKVSPYIVAKGLGASAVVPLKPEGLEVAFNRPIRIESDGSVAITNCGAVFPPGCLVGFDIDRSTIVLGEDYEVWYNLSTGMALFMSSAPFRPQVRVRINRISSINKLPSGLNLLPLIF